MRSHASTILFNSPNPQVLAVFFYKYLFNSPNPQALDVFFYNHLALDFVT